MIRIAITGPESTGKTQLAQELAQHYGVEAVDEYAREYLADFTGRYSLEDVCKISSGQQRLIEERAKEKPTILIADTEAIVCKIWAEYVFKEVPASIEKDLHDQQFDLYLLCSTDLPWTYDILRENPNIEERNELFAMYKEELERNGFNYSIVKGQGEDRTQSAIEAIDRLIASK